MTMSISFSRAAVAADVSMGVKKDLLLAIGIALAVSVACGAICMLLGWNFVGVAGIALGLMVGSTMCACLRAEAGALAGMCAATLSVAVLASGVWLQRSVAERDAIASAETDDSYVVALAEQIAWDPATPHASLEAASGTPGIAMDEIPPAVRNEAEARWRAMSAKEKQEFRDERRRWMEQMLGPDLDRVERKPTGWPFSSVAALSGVAALLSASWPAVLARYASSGSS